jgi:hypothetical protein
MTTGTVNVAVGEFVRTGIPHVNNLYVEMQILISQWVIPIDRYGIRTNVRYRNDLAIICLKLHAHLNVGLTECVTRYFANQPIVAPTVAFFGRYVNFEDIPFGATFQSFFHTGNQVVRSV